MVLPLLLGISSLLGLLTPHSPKMPTQTPIKPCAALPYGYGPRALLDTPLGFLTAPIFRSYAKSSTTPRGYDLVYANSHSASTSAVYLRYDELAVYNVHTCARRCDATRGCKAFNIFFERTPTLNVGPQCKNSLSSTTIKCALWGSELVGGERENTGYMLYDFQVVVAGSNAYNKNGEVVRTSLVSDGVPSVSRLDGKGMCAVVALLVAVCLMSLL
jgi:hypothetical protein